MKNLCASLSLFLIFLMPFSLKSYGQASCEAAVDMGSSYCNSGNLQNAATSSPNGSCLGATGTAYGVWYKFIANSTTAQVTISSLGSNLSAATTYIQLLSGNCASLTAISCNAVSAGTTNFTGLTPATTYYVRIYVTVNPTTNKRGFSITFNQVPANDVATNASTLSLSTSCTNIMGNLAFATASSPAITSSCTGTPGADVWYKFVPKTSKPTINLTSRGSAFTGTAYMQLLNSDLSSSISCTSGTGNLTLNPITLVPGQTYYIRIYTITVSPTGCGWNFNLCATEPALADLSYSKSYINVSKTKGGGVVEPGDTLEMRAMFVVKGSGAAADSLSFIDTLFHNNGLKLIPRTLFLRTNEGKEYGSAFTDEYDSDGGWIKTQPSGDTIIQMNFGTGGTSTKRGTLTNISKPSLYGSICIMMITYRVKVYAGFGKQINYLTGKITFKDRNIASLTEATFGSNLFTVYQSPGLCPNAISATNAIGVESNGTFGFPFPATTPLARNHTASLYTEYMYKPFLNDGSGPNDYYYAIANNSSAAYSIDQSISKPDASSPKKRLFGLWDITGDHTNASNIGKGNPPCDTTKPISATNPCGYALFVNSSYTADNVFHYTATNLCPNTYYEISAWFKNVCSRCGNDSNGKATSDLAYIPTAPGDSSGVRPNIAFEVNGIDYYTTGDILYIGTATGGKDTANRWQKRGFTYLTGPNQTSFSLTLRNNAPGGGGNDWALDDISIATCLPNMQYSPTKQPSICMDNSIIIGDTIRSYFNNYNYYKWEYSNNNGSTWTPISGQSGSLTPVNNNGQWEYVTSYTVPPTATKMANAGDKYRVMVATTSANLDNPHCQLTDGNSEITVSISDTCQVLPIKILSFNAQQHNGRSLLYWSTANEDEQVRFNIERSVDGKTFITIGSAVGKGMNSPSNNYTFTDGNAPKGQLWYRIGVISQQNKMLYTRIISLNNNDEKAAILSVTNPFCNDLLFDLSVAESGPIQLSILSLHGAVITKKTFQAYKGSNAFMLTSLQNLSQGIYVLSINTKNEKLTQKVMKR